MITGPLMEDIEAKWLCDVIRRINPSVFVEIGSRYGGSFEVFSQACKPGSQVISIDLPNGRWGRQDSEGPLTEVVSHLKNNGYDAHVIIGDSHQPETLTRLKQIISSRNIGFLFIDGDHTCSGVRQDFEMYGPLVKGAVAFHDIIPPNPNPEGVEVHRFYNEIKQNKKYNECIGRYGIGVIYL